MRERRPEGALTQRPPSVPPGDRVRAPSPGAGLALLWLPHTVISGAACGPGRGLPSHSVPLVWWWAALASPSARTSRPWHFVCPSPPPFTLKPQAALCLPLPLPCDISQSLPVAVGVLGGTDPRTSPGWLTCPCVHGGPGPFSHGGELRSLLPVDKPWALGRGHQLPPQQTPSPRESVDLARPHWPQSAFKNSLQISFPSFFFF